MLTNLFYTRFSADDFKKTSFTIDIITYFVQYLNLTGLDRKLETEDERNQLKFVWEECLPVEFTNYILQEDNYKVLSVLNLNYQKCSDVVLSYLKSGNHRLNVLT